MEINESTARFIEMVGKLTSEQLGFIEWLITNMAYLDEYEKRTGKRAKGPYARLQEALMEYPSQAYGRRCWSG